MDRGRRQQRLQNEDIANPRTILAICANIKTKNEKSIKGVTLLIGTFPVKNLVNFLL